jgi:hypothetical protein
MNRLENQIKSLRQAQATTFQRTDTDKHVSPVTGETVVHSKGQYDPTGLDIGPIDNGTRPKWYDHANGVWRLFSNIPKCVVIFEDGSLTGGTFTSPISSFYTDAPDLFGYGDEGGVQVSAENQFCLFWGSVNLGQPVRQGVHRLYLNWADISSPVMAGGNPFLRLTTDTSPGDQSNALTLMQFGRGNSDDSTELNIAYDLSAGLGNIQYVRDMTLVILWLGDYNPYTTTPFSWDAGPPAVPIIPPNPGE